MSHQISADSAQCQVTQAQAILSMWLESVTSRDGNLSDMIGAVMTLLDGVPEAMEAVSMKLSAYELKARGSKS